MREFESSHSSQPVRSLVFSRWALEGPQIRGFLHALLSLRFRDSNQNSLLGRKVSRVFPGNGRFAESKSGDWFDLPLSGEGDRILAKVLAQGRTRVFSFGQPASLKLWNDELDKLADVVHG